MSQEKKLLAEIKRTAKTGNEVTILHLAPVNYIEFSLTYLCLFIWQAATKILARQLVRLRQQIANLQGSRAQMRGIATHTQVDGQIFPS